MEAEDIKKLSDAELEAKIAELEEAQSKITRELELLYDAEEARD